jgi:hypothetical protein
LHIKNIYITHLRIHIQNSFKIQLSNTDCYHVGFAGGSGADGGEKHFIKNAVYKMKPTAAN